MSSMKYRPTRSPLNADQRWLDVGCGTVKHPTAIGMDRRKLDGVDVVHDAEVLPWPFAAGTFDKVLCSHVLEHLKPWLHVDLMDEMWRVLKPGGELCLGLPYANSPEFWQDPTHIKTWNETTPYYFDPDHQLYHVYAPRPWKVRACTWDGHVLDVLMTKVTA